MDDSIAAKKILEDGNMCVLCYKGMVFTNNKKGIVPLNEFLDSKFDFSMFSSAKDFIGLPEAFFYVKLGIKNIYAKSITKDALMLFDSYGIIYHYKDIIEEKESTNSVLYILVNNITDIDLGIKLLKEKLVELKEV